MIHHTLSKFLVAVPIACILLLTACSTSSVIQALDATVAAADAAVTALQAAGAIPAPTAYLITLYLGTVSKASGEAATELASSDTSAAKAEKISADFAAALLPDLTNAPVAVQAAVAAVNAAVQAFLASLHPAGLSPAFAGKVVRPGLSERYQLASIRRHAERVQHRLQ